jgi:hypothetical protein
VSDERAVILRTVDNEHFAAIEGVGEHQPTWAAASLVCQWCEEAWPCSTLEAVIEELEAQADGLCCSGILRDRVAQLRGEVSHDGE